MAPARKLENWLIWLNHLVLTSKKSLLIQLYALVREICTDLAYPVFALLSDPQQLLSRRKFIIYCQTRTGSTLLVDLLNCHPRVHCDREIFAFPTIFPARFIQAKRLIHFNKIYGCKIIGDQLEKQVGCEYMQPFLMELVRKGWKIIHLVRQDISRQAISQIIMEMSGNAHLYATEKREPIKYWLDPSRLQSHVEQILQKTLRDQQVLKSISCLRIVYERDLLYGNRHQETSDIIFDFLGLLATNVGSKFVKVNSPHLSNFIENHEDVKMLLNEWNHFWQ